MIISPAKRLEEVKEYYFSQKLAQLAQMRADGKDVLNLGIGSPDLAPDQTVIDALVGSAQNDKNHAYQGYKGLPELRDSMAIWYFKTYRVKLDRANEVLPLIGSKEGIMHISMAFLNPGDGVLVPNPGYPTYASVSKLVQAETFLYDLDEGNNWEPDFDALEKMDLSKVKIMWVNYPNMPTGAKASAELYDRLIAFGKKHSILIINDNPYSLILNDEPTSILSREGAKEVCLELNSLSKSHNLAGWRVGMLLGAQSYLDEVMKVKSNVDTGMFKGIQEAAIEALNLDESWSTQLNEEYQKRRELVWKIMDELDCEYDRSNGGMFVWAKIRSGESSETFIENILQKTFVFVTPGFIFGSRGDRYIRISLCADCSVFEETLERLKEKL